MLRGAGIESCHPSRGGSSDSPQRHAHPALFLVIYIIGHLRRPGDTIRLSGIPSAAGVHFNLARCHPLAGHHTQMAANDGAAGREAAAPGARFSPNSHGAIKCPNRVTVLATLLRPGEKTQTRFQQLGVTKKRRLNGNFLALYEWKICIAQCSLVSLAWLDSRRSVNTARSINFQEEENCRLPRAGISFLGHALCT
jgi:hypothetical protein